MNYNIPAHIKQALEVQRQFLAYGIENAVDLSFTNAHRICNGKEGEVDKVLQFFIDGVALIENHFNETLDRYGIEVSIASIFTHQTPYVRFATPAAPNSCCELADICILASYGDTANDPDTGLGNALFLQAKETFDAPLADQQRQLYESATRFQYDRPHELKGILPDRRRLPPKDESALSYWELRRFGRGIRWSHSPDVLVPFGTTLVDFLAAEAGYGFSAPAAGDDSWSRIIFDLLKVTANACANRKNLKVRERKRGTGTLYRLLFNQFAGNSVPFAVRNSMARILAHYGPEFKDLGRKIEEAPDYFEKREFTLGGDTPGGNEHRPPPPLGDNWQYEGDGNGGAGNIILIHFSTRD